MSTHEEDLDLLLSLQDRVSETPPSSPPPPARIDNKGYFSGDELPKGSQKIDMSAFKDTVKDCLQETPETVPKVIGSKLSKRSENVDVERFSGLRIGNMTLPSMVLNNRLSEVRFIRLTAIKSIMAGEMISGHWATVGVLTEKGILRRSSTGKEYSIWKLGCLSGSVVTLFLFGDAYHKNSKENLGTVFGLFNAGTRKDSKANDISLSVFSVSQIVKLGTSVDYAVCKGEKSDGSKCSMIINKSKGVYCKYHTSLGSKKYSTSRGELNGGNISRPFRRPFDSEGRSFSRPFQPEGIYMVAPRNQSNQARPAKVLTVEALKKALSNADQVTTKQNSQGKRFLAEVAGDRTVTNGSLKQMTQQKCIQKNRLSSGMNLAANMVLKGQHPEAKRTKTSGDFKNMIELELMSSDEE